MPTLKPAFGANPLLTRVNDFKQMSKTRLAANRDEQLIHVIFANQSVHRANRTVNAATCMQGQTVLNTCVGADMSPRLLGIAGPFQGTTVPLSEKAVSIGRDQANDIWISDTALSRRHCLLVGKGGQFTIRDLGSRNGTFVDGIQVTEQELREGDRITVGNSVFVFQSKQSDVSFEKSPVEFSETGKIEQNFVLKSENLSYVAPDSSGSTPQQTSRLARDLQTLLKISFGIGAIRDLYSLQWQLLGLIFDVIPAERGAIVLFDDTGGPETTVAWDRVRGPGSAVQISRTVLDRVRTECVGIVVTNVSQDPALARSKSLKGMQVHSVLCVPLMLSGKVAGAIYLDSSYPRTSFDEDHLRLMTAIACISSLAADNVRHWERLQYENQELHAKLEFDHNMLGVSPRMKEVFEFIRRAAPSDSTVLIQGESGTGKELVANAIHLNSSRSKGPFVAINCAAVAETLLESELFGHEKGAFTGALSQKKGKMESADGGTLFLDEVTELASALQAKLLRVLQEREFERVGGMRPIKLDIRLIAATNRNLTEAVKSGSFRADLYYRLNVVALSMPPLRDRREDIPLLADHFISKAARKCKVRVKPLSAEARASITSYDWPGNVRELENAMERALVLGSSDSILPEDLPEAVVEAGASPAADANYLGNLREHKRELILDALRKANGNYIAAAKTLGVHPNSLLRLIRNLDLKSAMKVEATSQKSV